MISSLLSLLPLWPLLVSAPVDGAPGVGDPLFPNLGNGGYDVASYDLDLDVDPDDNLLDGRCTIRAVAEASLRSFHLDLRGLEVDAVTVDGTEAAFEREDDELVVRPQHPLAAGASFEVVVDYHGSPGGVPSPALPLPSGVGWMWQGDEVYVLSEPAGAHGFFPCNDHPSDKARFAFEVTVPGDVTVAANGRLLGVDEEKDGRHTFRFAAKEPMATYLVTVNVGYLDRVEAKSPAGVPLVFYFPEGSVEDHEDGVAATGRLVDLFAEWFGPYPFEECGGIVGELPFPGALETQTRPLYGRGAFRPPVIAHELAHQWFGDTVTAANWREIWLAEGFATYATWLLTERDEGPQAYLRSVKRAHRQAKRGHVAPPADPPAARLFGGAVYARGALALHALRADVGREKLLEVLRAFVAEHGGGNATTEDFLATVARVAGEDAAAAVRPWIFDTEVPPLPES